MPMVRSSWIITVKLSEFCLSLFLPARNRHPRMCADLAKSRFTRPITQNQHRKWLSIARSNWSTVDRCLLSANETSVDSLLWIDTKDRVPMPVRTISEHDHSPMNDSSDDWASRSRVHVSEWLRYSDNTMERHNARCSVSLLDHWARYHRLVGYLRQRKRNPHRNGNQRTRVEWDTRNWRSPRQHDRLEQDERIRRYGRHSLQH